MKKVCSLLLFVTLLFAGVINVHAEDMSNTFKAILTDGKVVINSVEPKNENEAYAVLGEYIPEKFEGFIVDLGTCNSTYTKCTVVYHSHMSDQESHEVDFNYVYDANIKNIVANYVSTIKGTKPVFHVEDLELVNFWANGADIESYSKYSGEFKRTVDNKNFSIDVRQGESAEFITSVGGIGKFSYEGTPYYIYSNISFTGKHIIYLPSDTGTTKEQLRLAAQKKFDDYLGTGKAVITAGTKTVEQYYTDLYNDEIDRLQAEYDAEMAKPQNERNMSIVMSNPMLIGFEEDYLAYFQEQYTDDGTYAFLKNCEGNYYFVATIDENEYMFVVNRDSSKMTNPKYISSDVGTNITISSNESVIPLDTLIKVSQLTSGADYDRIMNILKVANCEMFDLRLYSSSLDQNITQLADGTFEVRIPISEKFKGKNLIVYYVDSEGNKKEYPVTPDGNYAVFNTNHFSIYTLASTGTAITNPKTGDNIASSILLLLVSVVGLTGTCLYIKRKNIKLIDTL